jgi:hypothetical protein
VVLPNLLLGGDDEVKVGLCARRENVAQLNEVRIKIVCSVVLDDFLGGGRAKKCISVWEGMIARTPHGDGTADRTGPKLLSQDSRFQLTSPGRMSRPAYEELSSPTMEFGVMEWFT